MTVSFDRTFMAPPQREATVVLSSLPCVKDSGAVRRFQSPARREAWLEFRLQAVFAKTA
jgi:hypothetical protein